MFEVKERKEEILIFLQPHMEEFMDRIAIGLK